MLKVISVRNLDHYFGNGSLRKQVLFNINLEISAGEIVILTGPSGSGKTTLLNLVGGLRSPLVERSSSPLVERTSSQSASLRVLGQELYGASAERLVQARRRNGYIFQGHNLHGSLTALQNVKMGLELHQYIELAELETRAIQILEQVGLGNHLHYYPDQLSGGQKQRVAIARALVSHPQLVLADEPTASLDSQSGRDVVNLMQKLAHVKGSTILMVTHDHRILNIADRIVQMEDGRLMSPTPAVIS
ncbi:ABC transporter-like protein [Trichormus variabilis ATCC 29413]|uniref:ABC transporter-like protein n=2 Tax=Anabaena variabilis TaxID=264691 RepID=Q3MFL3_TRIV2|nr:MULTISPECIES: DevA family ABC transporter ATP-binding protein [Nostocaceae]ABA20223.1 ABC transporter-like protein [Trichormus variabilis ATCC 29413]MBC1215077.1 DevA family ABC transporter ATP-binding protein [Trichormus variabilis ARAD]MBC1257188.1 DevA family ABC transporter ATP-binding protein [Trichormus variabilis V5]MBC1267676.1 DevA family ABC transporter ATP-binding protein [Trichormus variabilis FSR]MBC1303385.1 DevA family ABC transporter ATP-binding protein [Trichormus variabili